MAKELGQTTDPKELVPGTGDSVSDTLWMMRGYGDALHDAGEGLKRIDTTEEWSGKAADSFREVFHGQPAKWLEAGDCFHSAANALENYVSTLQWAQQQASEAIRLWNESQAATNQAKADHEHAVQQAQQEAAAKTASGTPTVAPDIPFTDPGTAKRQAARDTLDRARSQLNSAGDTAADAVAKARDKAPEKPGFWSHVGDFFSDLGHGIENVGADVLNGLASVGNAAANHPGDVLLAAGGAALTVVSAAGDGLGVVLDATGVGAVAGVPLNAVSTAGVVAGGGMVVAAMGDLGRHAAGDDKVSPVKSGRGGGDSGTPRGSDGELTYEKSPKHGTEQRGNAAPAPTNGQQALENSVSIKPTTSRRVSVDPATGEYVVFDETYPGSGIYHGHAGRGAGPTGSTRRCRRRCARLVWSTARERSSEGDGRSCNTLNPDRSGATPWQPRWKAVTAGRSPTHWSASPTTTRTGNGSRTPVSACSTTRTPASAPSPSPAWDTSPGSTDNWIRTRSYPP
jgi:hypothetical protein